MSGMVRKQVYPDKKQVQALRKRPEASRLSESELIRRAIDELLKGAKVNERPDPSALESMEASLKALKANNPAGQTIQFDRDEIFEQRLGR